MRPILLILCVMCFGQLGFSQNDDLKERLSKIIDRSGFSKSDLGLAVYDTHRNPLFTLNPQKRFIPASITKLFTAAAAFHILKPDYKFKTQILIDGNVENGILKGNIYLLGGGDPTFVSEKMWMLVNEFTRTGIKKVVGDIVVDDTFFDAERVDEGREESNVDRAYNALLSGLSFNWNSTTLWVRPGAKSGDPAAVWVDPENEFVTLKNKAVTTRFGTDLNASREDAGTHDQVVVTGKIAAGSPEKHFYKNINNPSLFAGANLRVFLKQREIDVTGKLRSGVTPKSARFAAEQTGQPLDQVIEGMNKFSNNFIAEMLAKNIGAFQTGKQGRMADGLSAIRKFIESDLKIAKDTYVLENVSGFSRKNSFTADQFIRVMEWVQEQFQYQPEFIHSLPVAGVDGTLKDRMKNTPAERRVRGKTGSLNGVVSLAGYAGRESGALLFCFIYNGKGDEGHVRGLFDQLAVNLVK